MGNIGHDAEERRRNAIAFLDADLRGLLQVKEVEETVQAKLVVAKVRSMSRMSTIADDRGKMRAFCVDALGLDEARDVVEIASLVDTWESASTRVPVRNKAEAEARVASLPRALNKIEIQDLLVKFQKIHGIKLEDRNTPAASTLEQVYDQIEQGEMKNMNELGPVLKQGGCRGRRAGCNDREGYRHVEGEEGLWGVCKTTKSRRVSQTHGSGRTHLSPGLVEVPTEGKFEGPGTTRFPQVS